MQTLSNQEEKVLMSSSLVSSGNAFSYPEPILRAVNGARQGALAKSISNWHLIGYNEGYCSNNVYILLPCFYGIRFWIWPEPLVAPRVRRALGTRMLEMQSPTSFPGLQCEDEARHEEALVWAGHVTTKNGSI